MRSRRRRRANRGKVTTTPPMAYQAPAAEVAPVYSSQSYGQNSPYAEQQAYDQSYSAPAGAPPQYGSGDYSPYTAQGVEMPAATHQAK